MAKSRRARRKELRRKRKPVLSAAPRPNRLAIAKVMAKHKAEPPPRDVIDQDRAWYIVQTFPGREEQVEKRIRDARLGLTYRPREIVKRGRRGKLYHTTRHLMPRCMFFGCARGADPRTLLDDVQGFYGLLRRTDGLIVRVTAPELQRFADVVSDELAPLAGAGNTVLKAKDEVMLNSGPFVGFRAVVLAPARGGFVRLSITLRDVEQEFTAPIDGLLAA